MEAGWAFGHHARHLGLRAFTPYAGNEKAPAVRGRWI
jgi:hypothetical protein